MRPLAGGDKIPLRDEGPSSARQMRTQFNPRGSLIRAYYTHYSIRCHYLVLANAYVANAAGKDDLAANRGSLISDWCYENRARGSARRI